MKLLHTSDWHLGRALYGRKRNDEFSQFLDWLLDTISSRAIDVLLIAGDIFDTTTPSNWAQNLYYQFLTRIQQTGCRHVVITAGNHDSASFLEAPAGILKTMNIHVIGSIDDNIHKEIITIKGTDETPQLIICAVPYLRERDIRSASPGETVDEKSAKLIQGIQNHYDEVVSHALQLKTVQRLHVPIIALGHLFAAGGQSVKGDGVRELYVGSLAHVPASIFPDEIDYLALGHLHSSQRVAGDESRRYCGSPLPVSFAEGKKAKSVIQIECTSNIESIAELEVPCFQRLESLEGDLQQLLEKMTHLRAQNCSIWLEIKYTGEELIPHLQETLREAVAGSKLEILRILNTRIINSVLSSETSQETLEELSVEEVFARCLAQNDISGEQQNELTLRFNQAMEALQQNDQG
ncbi:exonuclease SbcCD subunit D C-terminal domain-containing protein [Desulforhopalus sp. IMCC35007]|uniref:exonuclease SbcCD subunit D C-terminal domain-containing protein n=1 Tax=Desulforhopalus sp. IMCC35007 TaxID=2569543 RepID=UPI0010AEAD75|nr:exonuclease SbcCD subunit D C-terminal domain-containing protein [Desulforhopalus sp. IMCC35007]TKB06049.1 exonuclease subunit SbcD [Desulforhopalus sp. IMCC35007]